MTPRVLFADADLVVVDKPSGMPSVPARTPLDPVAVADRLADVFGPLEAAHRLDRDTSGLLVLARNRPARAALGRAFERRDVQKRYLAVVAARPPGEAGEIHLPLAADRDRPPRHRVDHAHGKMAVTRWRRLAISAADCPLDRGGCGLLAIEPVTGRSHQIRVHLASLGCPIAGDRLYGPPAAETDLVPLALHATAIDLPHPTTAARLAIVSPPPDRPPWDRFTAAIIAALAAWPIGPPAANTWKSVPGH